MSRWGRPYIKAYLRASLVFPGSEVHQDGHLVDQPERERREVI